MNTHSRARMLTAVPPFIWPTVRLAPFGAKGEAGSAPAASCSDRSERKVSSLIAAILALAPMWVRLEWASWPVTVTL